MWLFALFVLLPLVEIALFITVGSWLTLWPTLAIVLGSAVLGSTLLRRQGLRTMMELRSSFNEMRDPSGPLADGAMILLSGALLVTPGFLTDTIGLLLLIPTVRRAVFAHARRHVRVQSFVAGRPGPMPGAGPTAGPGRGAGPRPGPGGAGGETIDGEFHEVPPGKRPTHPPSGWTRH